MAGSTVITPAMANKIILPEPGQTFMPGVELKTVEFMVTNRTTKRALQDQLHLYGLPSTGTKLALLESLQEFSHNRDAWISLFEPAKKRKRGVHNSRSSLSTKRIATQFGKSENEPAIAYKSKKSVNRVQRALTDQDRTANTNWAGAILGALGVSEDLSLASPTKRRCTENTVADNAAHAPISNSQTNAVPTADSSLTVRVRRLERKLDQGLLAMLDRFDGIQDALTTQVQPSSPTTTLAQATARSSGASGPVSISGAQDETGRAVGARSSSTELDPHHHDASTETVCPQPIPTEFLGVAHLEPPHAQFPFDIRLIPDPPAINFSNDIDRLFREWESSLLLVVNGHGIPVKHWGQFYKRAAGAKGSAWDALKTKWGKWKFIVEERNKCVDDASFWAQFSTETGERLCYQQILNKIARARIDSDKQDAANARLFFGGNLDDPSANGTFRYTWSGTSYTLTKDGAIAKAWRTLLATQPSIAERWEALHILQPAMQSKHGDRSP